VRARGIRARVSVRQAQSRIRVQSIATTRVREVGRAWRRASGDANARSWGKPGFQDLTAVEQMRRASGSVHGLSAPVPALAGSGQNRRPPKLAKSRPPSRRPPRGAFAAFAFGRDAQAKIRALFGRTISTHFYFLNHPKLFPLVLIAPRSRPFAVCVDGCASLPAQESRCEFRLLANNPDNGMFSVA
jgi:hypothetical protein